MWIVPGALAGGLLVGLFPAHPRWLWGIGGGIAGALLAMLASWIGDRPWHPALRAAAVLAVLGFGFFLLFLLVGRQWITDPRNMRIGSP